MLADLGVVGAGEQFIGGIAVVGRLVQHARTLALGAIKNELDEPS